MAFTLPSSNFSTSMPRWQASLELLKKEFTRGIEGGKDVVDDVVQGTVNAVRTGIQGALEIGPAIVHSITGQKFSVKERDGVADGTMGAVGNTIEELKNGKVLSAIYTLLAEIFPDGLFRDGMQGHTVVAEPS